MQLESLCLRQRGDKLELLDQTLIPAKEEWIEITCAQEMIEAIKRLAIRGAPAIGVGAAMALALEAKKGASVKSIRQWAQALYEARPTAVNLMWAMERLALKVDLEEMGPSYKDFIINEACKLFLEDQKLCQEMAKHGAALIQDGDQILTHCNTGGLATVGIGTALGVIRLAHEQGKKIHVWVDETRPLLQGGRLTAWECQRVGIPYTLICDNMAAMLMKKKRVDKIFVGADRVAANGDFANKIGTYSLSILAKAHAVDFYPVAPYSTVDALCPTGLDIPIEERAAFEVQGVRGSFGDVMWAPKEAKVFNPAFDVTEACDISAFVFDHGVYSPQQLARGEHLLANQDQSHSLSSAQI